MPIRRVSSPRGLCGARLFRVNRGSKSGPHPLMRGAGRQVASSHVNRMPAPGVPRGDFGSSRPRTPASAHRRPGSRRLGSSLQPYAGPARAPPSYRAGGPLGHKPHIHKDVLLASAPVRPPEPLDRVAQSRRRRFLPHTQTPLECAPRGQERARSNPCRTTMSRRFSVVL